MVKIKDMTKGELKRLINLKNGCIARQSAAVFNYKYQIRNFNLRLKKIRNEIDYLLEHPYSKDVGVTIPKHSRDDPKNRRKKKKK